MVGLYYITIILVLSFKFKRTQKFALWWWSTTMPMSRRIATSRQFLILFWSGLKSGWMITERDSYSVERQHWLIWRYSCFTASISQYIVIFLKETEKCLKKTILLLQIIWIWRCSQELGSCDQTVWPYYQHFIHPRMGGKIAPII